jgi:hypothetical protein
MKKQPIDVSKLSAAELKELAHEASIREKQAEAQAKAEYTRYRERAIVNMMTESERLEKTLADFKKRSSDAMAELYAKMMEYAKVTKPKKGNFELISECKTMKIEYAVQAIKKFDERANAAEQHLRSFMDTAIGRKNKEVFKLVTTLLEKKMDGQYDFSLISKLYRMENDYDHPDWLSALKLFKESYIETGSKPYIRFYTKSGESGWRQINLNFSNA